MKIFPVYPLVIVLGVGWMIPPTVYAAGHSHKDAANECEKGLQFYRDAATSSPGVRATESKKFSDSFLDPYPLEIGNQTVPVLTFRVAGSPLIVLIHRELNSQKETPVIDAICPDTSGHHLTYRKPLDRIEFNSAPGEHVTMMFRINSKTLPNTHWRSQKNDSIWMVEVPEPPPAEKAVPRQYDWCAEQKKDIRVSGTDMSFNMCSHEGTAKGFEYTVRMTVNGALFPIDPQIINRPH